MKSARKPIVGQFPAMMNRYEREPQGVHARMYEHRRDPILSREAFLSRLLRHAGIAMGILAGSLVIGVAGFRFLADTAWIDALLNAAMLLGGMGPVGELQNWSAPGKIFASIYALYSGLVFLIVASVLIAPVFHRFLHHFHLEMSDKKKAVNK